MPALVADIQVFLDVASEKTWRDICAKTRFAL
jgi:hypothetical protein